MKDNAAEELLNSPHIKALRLKRHLKDMQDPIYREGFEAPNHFAPPYPKNPYTFPEEISRRLNRLAVKPELSKEEVEELVAARTELEDSDWSKWSAGNFAKHCLGGVE